jgi:riboflavin kinase / FMN adenylyltransferase
MQVHFGEELIRAEWPKSVACIGTFDGVHLGHREVISTAVARAGERGLPGMLVTFDRHPAAILAPERCPKAIAPLVSNLKQFEALGVSLALILPFTKALSETTAQEFLDHVLIGELKSELLVVGHDFAFGKGREGTPEWLKPRIETEVVPPFEMDAHRVSSSEIRTLIQAGSVELARRLLGRPFAIHGSVVGGDKLGRKLGFPTVNIARSYDGVLPMDGVYSGIAHTSKGTFQAAISIGFRPTVAGAVRVLEAFLLEFPNVEIYGSSVDLEFHHRLREQAKFDSLEALKDQMARDIESIANNPACP